jgi:hypothetical protein
MANFCAQCNYLDLSDNKYGNEYYCKDKGRYYKGFERSCSSFSYRPSCSPSGKICGDCLLMDLKDRKYDNEYYCWDKGRYYPTNRSACYDFVGTPAHSSSCYITTIVCDILGYSDDCQMLKTLRDFRENILKPDENMHPLLQEYDQIGPIISNNLATDQDRKLAALELLSFLNPCCEAIMNKEYNKAIEIYKSMVLFLKLKYNLLREKVDYSIKAPIEELGKGRTRTKLTSENI